MSYKIRKMQIARRRASGQSLVQGVLVIMLLVGLTVAAVLFLCNVGMSIYYKEKLTFAANQAAQFAFTQTPGPVRKSQTEAFVKEFLKVMGLPPQKTLVDVDDTGSIGGQPVIKVTVVNNCNLLGSGNLLPAFITMSSTGFASSPTTIVGAPGPPGPQGPTGARGPAGPPGRVEPLDGEKIRDALGISAVGEMFISTDRGGAHVAFPIYGPRNSFAYLFTLVFGK